MSKLYRKGGPIGQRGLLEEMLLVQIGELGRIPKIGFGSYEEYVLADVALDLGANKDTEASCTIMVESDGTETDSKKVIRFNENGNTPTAGSGMFLGDGDVMEISSDSMPDFKFISTEIGKSHKILVQFYVKIERDIEA